MSNDLSKDDLKRIRLDTEFNKIIEYLRRKEELAFNVGDILICLRLYKQHSGEKLEAWKPVTISAQSAIPKRWKVVYKNEQGVCWVKQFKADGAGLCQDISCLASIDLSHRKMVVDPDYADHIMLDHKTDFIFSEAYENEKVAKLKAKSHNKSISIDTDTLYNIEDFFSSRKKGDKFWYSKDYSSLKKSNITGIEYQFDGLEYQFDGLERDASFKSFSVKYSSSSRHSSLGSFTFSLRLSDFVGAFLLTDEKPISFEDLI